MTALGRVPLWKKVKCMFKKSPTNKSDYFKNKARLFHGYVLFVFASFQLQSSSQHSVMLFVFINLQYNLTSATLITVLETRTNIFKPNDKLLL